MNLGAINKHPKIENDAEARFIAAQASRTLSQTFLSSSLLRWINADELARPPFVFKLHNAIDQREQRIVLAAADVVAGFPLRATLPRDDVAAEHALAAEFLQTESLRL
jgi:hypothetical protein